MLARAVAGDDEELLSAPARHMVAVTADLAQPLGHLHQHSVAGRVTVLVVDLLEVVDVD
jgi:hypothetical protein